MILQPAPADRIARISIRTPRAGSDLLVPGNVRIGAISIHAPRAGSDRSSMICDTETGISLHAPRAGSDIMFRLTV